MKNLYNMSMWVLEAPFLFSAAALSSKDGALISIPQGAGPGVGFAFALNGQAGASC